MKKILLVDDNSSLVKLYHQKFAESGFGVLDAFDGEEWLRIALREHPALILLDIKMSKMDGMTMLKKLREDAWGKNAPIVVVSNFDTDDERLKMVAREEPAFYLSKKITRWKIYYPKSKKFWMERRRESCRRAKAAIIY